MSQMNINLVCQSQLEDRPAEWAREKGGKFHDSPFLSHDLQSLKS